MTSVTREVKAYSDIDSTLPWVDKCCTKIIKNGATPYITISDSEFETTRGTVDNSKFHAIMNDIWKQASFSIGSNTINMSDYSFPACKAMLVTWFVNELAVIGDDLPKYMIPEKLFDPISDSFITIRPSTTNFSKKISASFCQFLWSTGCDGGVKWTDKATAEYETWNI